MCTWGTDVRMDVPMPARVAHNGVAQIQTWGIDACIAPLVAALNAAGLYTVNCCCGHGKADGLIILWDGREVRVSLESTREPEAPPAEVATKARAAGVRFLLERAR